MGNVIPRDCIMLSLAAVTTDCKTSQSCSSPALYCNYRCTINSVAIADIMLVVIVFEVQTTVEDISILIVEYL